MSLFDRMKRAVKSKANAAIDKHIDPEKELDMAILELEETRRNALQELVSYKATAKQMERDMEREQKAAEDWEKRAMAALKAGDEDLARQALRKQKEAQAEHERIKRDRDEAASYAIQLNKSRKTAETKLQMLKLRKGTLATQLKAGRTGSVLGVDNSVFERFEEAEGRIDDEAIEAEVHAAMEGEDFGGGGGAKALSEAQFDVMLGQKMLEGGGPDAVDPDDPLEQLKAKMRASAEAKRKALAAGGADKPGAGKPDSAHAGAGEPGAGKPGGGDAKGET